MPVSGLVISLTDEPTVREQAVAAIRQETRIEVGPIQSGRMAVVLDTASSDEDKQLWDWLSAIPGVVFIDVTMIGFEDPRVADAGDAPASGDGADGAIGSRRTPNPLLNESPADGC